VWVSTETVASRAVLTVDNTGLILAAESVDRLFEPFWRLHEPTSPRPGAGLSVKVSLPARTG
jgi:signal transduction histidine kinase